MDRWFDFGIAGTAFLAALFWFLSAYGPLPPMVAYFDAAPAADPFYVAMKWSGHMNAYAAALSCLSATLIGIRSSRAAGRG